MVEFSLRKARNNWQNKRQGAGVANGQPPDSSTRQNQLKNGSKNAMESLPSQDGGKEAPLPTMNARDRSRVASIMQRRLSVHNPGHGAPSIDFSAPLPSVSAFGMNSSGSPGISEGETTTNAKPMASLYSRSSGYTPAQLRKMLSDPSFDVSSFVHNKLGTASALDIDNFTSNLSELSIQVQDEIKLNINRSYREIMTVNNDLSIASAELKQLRMSINELGEVMDQFKDLADKKIQEEETYQKRLQNQESTSSNSGLLPPMKTASRVHPHTERASVMILGKMWDQELTKLYKEVEGSQKYITQVNGRHILLSSENWKELNTTTLKAYHKVKLFILNDMILVAEKPRDNKNEFVISRHALLKDVNIVPDKSSRLRLIFKFGNTSSTLYEAPDLDKCEQFLSTFRSAKDDLHDILKSEAENSQKIKESFVYLHQTPGKETSKSPIKVNRRSQGPLTPGRNSEVEQRLLQNISLSVHSRPLSRDASSVTHGLKVMEDALQEVNIEYSRVNLEKAVDILTEVKSELQEISGNVVGEDVLLYNLISLKINEREEAISSKLSMIILFNNDIYQLKSAIRAMVKLDLSREALDLLLQNRSNVIQDLILQIGSSDHPTIYLTQLAVVRFQTIKATVLNFQELFDTTDPKVSSILVTWCSEEVDKHFQLISKQLLNEDILSPMAIKSSRKQIDNLKPVGLDFVYKLDEFIKKNSDKLQ